MYSLENMVFNGYDYKEISDEENYIELTKELGKPPAENR